MMAITYDSYLFQGFWVFIFHAVLKDDVLPVLICPKRVQKRKLQKKPSFPTDTSTIGTHSPASGKNSNEDFFPTGLAYATNNKIKGLIEIRFY